MLAATLGAVTVLWLVAATTAYFDTKHDVDELLDGYLAQTAAMLLARAGEETGEIDIEHAPQLHKYARHLVFQVWERGRLRLHSAHAPDTPLATGSDGFADATIDGRRWRVFTGSDALRGVIVHVGEARRERDELAAGIARSLLVPLGIALPLLALMLWPAVTVGLQPLRRLRGEVESRDPRNLAPIDVDAPTEVAPLVASLNRLFARVRESIEHEKRFTADAAHELRTPVAALRVQAQVALGAASDDERRRALAQVLAGCDRVTRLIGQLLTLAGLEPPAAERAAQFGACDVGAIVRTVVAEAAPLAIDKSIDVELDARSEARVDGNAELIAILARNLVDNAIRYSPPGSAVSVTVAALGQSVELRVGDNGPGVPPPALARLGERFFREPGSAETGSGLGLSIVRRIAELHAASVAFAAGPQRRGLIVTVRFPASRSAAAPSSPTGAAARYSPI
jgi:two-component system sensor histidine kinase QseC